MTKTRSVTREFPYAPEFVFDTWLLPEVRRQVLLRNRYKNGVKALDPVEGGCERFEDRWRNRLTGEGIRTYVSITRPTEIVADVTYTTNRATTPKLLPATEGLMREVLRFEAVEAGTKLVLELQAKWIKPAWLGPLQQWDDTGWQLDLDVFEGALKERAK